MTVLLGTVVIALSVALGVALGVLGVRPRRHPRPQPAAAPPGDAPRILFPFIATALSRRALDTALRLARAEGSILMPVFLARVPLTLPLDAPLPRQCRAAIALQEAIEQRAAAFGVPVDARIERGRSYRHALRQAIAHERCERIVVAAAAAGRPGFAADDVAWLLDNAPGEIVVLRPASEEPVAPTAGALGASRAALSRAA